MLVKNSVICPPNIITELETNLKDAGIDFNKSTEKSFESIGRTARKPNQKLLLMPKVKTKKLHGFVSFIIYQHNL